MVPRGESAARCLTGDATADAANANAGYFPDWPRTTRGTAAIAGEEIRRAGETPATVHPEMWMGATCIIHLRNGPPYLGSRVLFVNLHTYRQGQTIPVQIRAIDGGVGEFRHGELNALNASEHFTMFQALVLWQIKSVTVLTGRGYHWISFRLNVRVPIPRPLTSSCI